MDQLVYGVAAFAIIYLLTNFSWFTETYKFLAFQPLSINLTSIIFSAYLLHILQDRYYLIFPKDRGGRIDLQQLLRYPTLHFAVMIALCIFLLFSYLKFNISLTPNSFDGLYAFVFTFSYSTFYALKEHALSVEVKNNNSDIDHQGINLKTCSSKDFERWLHSEDHDESIDFFDRVPIVNRMVQQIETDKTKPGQRGQVLYGEYGSGKTTIVKMVERKLIHNAPNDWIVSTFDSWGRSEKPELLIEVFLEQVIKDIGQQVEAVNLKKLPQQFIRAAYGFHPLISIFHSLVLNKSPVDVLKAMDATLENNSKRLLIVIENIDRGELDGKFSQSIGSLLDKVSELKNVRFIFTCKSNDEGIRPIVNRLADTIEELPESACTEELLEKFFRLCVDHTDTKIIIPWMNEDRTEYLGSKTFTNIDSEIHRLKASNASDEKIANMRWTPNDPIFSSLSHLLSNARSLKLVLRTVYQRWEVLQGEVNLVDLLVHFTIIFDSNMGLNKHVEDYNREWLEQQNSNNPYVNDRSKNHKDIVAHYYLGGSQTTENRFQAIIKESAHNKKYLVFSASGAVDNLKSDQYLINILLNISEGELSKIDELIKIISDYKENIEEILFCLIKYYWQDLSPLINILSNIISSNKISWSGKDHGYLILILKDAVLTNMSVGTDTDKNVLYARENLSRSLNIQISEQHYAQVTMMLYYLLCEEQFTYELEIFSEVLISFVKKSTINKWLACVSNNDFRNNFLYLLRLYNQVSAERFQELGPDLHLNMTEILLLFIEKVAHVRDQSIADVLIDYGDTSVSILRENLEGGEYIDQLSKTALGVRAEILRTAKM